MGGAMRKCPQCDTTLVHWESPRMPGHPWFCRGCQAGWTEEQLRGGNDEAQCVRMADGGLVLVSLGVTTLKVFLLDPVTGLPHSEYATLSLADFFPENPTARMRRALLAEVAAIVAAAESSLDIPFYGYLRPATPGGWGPLQAGVARRLSGVLVRGEAKDGATRPTALLAWMLIICAVVGGVIWAGFV